jgi:hypothetical protein
MKVAITIKFNYGILKYMEAVSETEYSEINR